MIKQSKYSGVCERTLEGHTDRVKSMVLLFDGRICSVSDDDSAKIWSRETGECHLTVEVGSTLIDVIQLHDGRLLVRNYVNEVYIVGEYCSLHLMDG